MNRHSGARWFYSRPRWLQMLVYNLTGWQVQKMTIRRRHDAGLFAYTTERVTFSWSRARKLQ